MSYLCWSCGEEVAVESRLGEHSIVRPCRDCLSVAMTGGWRQGFPARPQSAPVHPALLRKVETALRGVAQKHPETRLGNDSAEHLAGELAAALRRGGA